MRVAMIVSERRQNASSYDGEKDEFTGKNCHCRLFDGRRRVYDGRSGQCRSERVHRDRGAGLVRGYPAYYGYDYYRPCEYYLNNDLPAPRRCYNYFYNVWGPGLYFDGNFIFRDRAHW